MDTMPALAWRFWTVTSSLTAVGSYGTEWNSKELVANCQYGHRAPQKDCECGIYALFNLQQTKRKAREMMSMKKPPTWTKNLFWLWLISTGSLMTLALNAIIIWPDFSEILILLGVLSSIPVALTYMYFTREKPNKPHLFGVIAITGKTIVYSGGMRAEKAKVIALVRPKGVDQQIARSVANKMGVPWFEERDQRAILRYASEHTQVLVQSTL